MACLRVLFVASEVPWPPHSGASLRNYHVLRRLAANHDITLLCWRGAGARDVSEAEGALGCRIIIGDGESPAHRGPGLLREWLVSLREGLPLLVRRYRSLTFAAALRDLCSDVDMDLIQFDAAALAQYAAEVPVGVPTLVTVKDIEALVWQRMARVEPNPLIKLFRRVEARRLWKFEARMLPQFPCVAVSQLDQERLQAWFGVSNAFVVENGVASDEYAGRCDSRSETILYTGALDWRPNQDAANWFVRKIYPLIQHHRPTVKLAIVGRNPSSWIERLEHDHLSILVHGNVPDIRPHLREAAVFVVPLRAGGGTRLKILEAMAAGLPVVSTSIGAEGLDLIPDQHLLLADAPRQFAQHVVAIMSNKARAQKLAEAARAKVRAQYDWSHLAARLEGVWHNICMEYNKVISPFCVG